MIEVTSGLDNKSTSFLIAKLYFCIMISEFVFYSVNENILHSFVDMFWVYVWLL